MATHNMTTYEYLDCGSISEQLERDTDLETWPTKRSFVRLVYGGELLGNVVKMAGEARTHLPVLNDIEKLDAELKDLLSLALSEIDKEWTQNAGAISITIRYAMSN